MPATEKQFVKNIRDVLPTDSKTWNVVIISNDSDSDSALIEEIGSSNIKIFKSLNEAHEVKDLDVVIANRVFGQGIDNHEALDKFVRNVLQVLKFSGVLVFREDLSGLEDTKKVAKLTDYFDVFRTEVEGKNSGFDFYAVVEVEASIYVNQNWHDYFWVLTKKEFPATKGDLVTFRDFLDKTQYTDTGIYAYEWIFGDNFISPGGWPQNLSIIKRFGDMQAGQKMLDIGVGIGGGARQVASEFGVHVTGIDLSSNMLAVALDRVHKEKDSRVKYAICDAVKYKFEPSSFDYVFSRDCIQHIEDTDKLFSAIYNCLKPGGKVLITMYGVGYGELSEKFKSYVEQRQYYLKNLDQIRQHATKAGFVDIETENLTPRFKEILGEERSRVENNKEEFLQKFSQKEYDSLVNGWNSKLQYIADDNHNWNLFLATKPAH
ncbi:unnamed protein product [Auanema sp. JU1783]|nr:unnamed protein product [Auanema sp. JU1783]